jgi:long-chain fatty acid transport protein
MTMQTGNTLRSGLLAALALSAATPALADDYHYNNLLIGDRASGMGGAYTAVADDASGLYYNPAGITYIGGRNLSASVNAYHITSIKYRDVLGGGDWTRESSKLLPNFFGVAQPLGDGVAGFSYAVTDSILENQDTVLNNLPGTDVQQYIINMNNEENTYKIGPSYARAVNDKLSFGISLYLHLRDTETIFNQNISLNDTSYEWSSYYQQSEELGIEPVLGVMWSPVEKVSLGASLRKTELLSASLDSQRTCASDVPDNPNPLCTEPPTASLSSSDYKREYPWQLSLGAAYFPNERLLYSIDYTYYTEASNDLPASNDSAFRTKEATWNLKLGTEYYLSSRWALRGGLYTNHANTPALSSGRTDQPQHLDMYGFSLSGSRFTRNSSLTLGLSYGQGSGEAQVISGLANTQDVDAYSLSIFLSTSYSY